MDYTTYIYEYNYIRKKKQSDITAFWYEEMPRIIVKAIFAPNYCHFCFTNNFGISQPIPARVISID